MKKRTVYQVDSVELTLINTKPPQVNISASGSANTTGWADAELIPFVYVQAPPNGVYDFTLVAYPPVGPAGQMITPLPEPASLTEFVPLGFRGVTIHAESNTKQAFIGPESAAICVHGKLTDEGVECQALRSDDGKLFTLVGDLKGFKIGDEVYVSGHIAPISFCMQGITVAITWIGKTAPKLL
jgi:hypothetical protein